MIESLVDQITSVVLRVSVMDGMVTIIFKVVMVPIISAALKVMMSSRPAKPTEVQAMFHGTGNILLIM